MAGEADLFPQDITRPLLNFICNDFYAATKRGAETDGGNYEPTLAAATKSLGDRVEITIRESAGEGQIADLPNRESRSGASNAAALPSTSIRSKEVMPGQSR